MDKNIENSTSQNPNPIRKNKRSKFFHKIAFLGLDDKMKTEVAEEIVEEGNFGKIYRVQLVLSSIICTLGLLINSVPVIIGAMLIAPILLPIKTLAFSITTGNRHMYNRAIKFAVLSIVGSILTAIIITYLTPLAKLTPEITARISPTLIDLFIALASGIIAFLSLGYKKLRENLAGVAMATALVPPLCVTGIGLIFTNIEIAKGSFLLFLTNFFAIILVGIIIFFIFGFFSKDNKGKERSISTIIITFLIIVAIAFPLTDSMKGIADDIKTNQILQQTSKDFLKSINTDIAVENINYQNIDADKIRVNIKIDVPNTILITQQDKDDFSRVLAASTQKSVELDVNIVSISSVYIEQKKQPSKEEILQDNIGAYIGVYTDILIVETKVVYYNESQLLYVNLFSQKEQDQEKIQKDIEEITQKVLGKNAIAIVLWHQNGNTPETLSGTITNTGDMQKEKYTTEIKSFLQTKLGNTQIENINISGSRLSGDTMIINLKLSSGLSTKEMSATLKDIKKQLETLYKKKFQLHTQISFFTEIDSK